jgi:hypothetical protein
MSRSRKPGRPPASGCHSVPGLPFAPEAVVPSYLDVATAAYPVAQFVPHLASGPLMIPTQFHNLKFQDLDVLSAPYPLPTQRRNSFDGGFCGSYGLDPGCMSAVEKFPALDAGSYLPFTFDPNDEAAPSVSVSSHSSNTSRRSSARSTLSSIQTEIPQHQQQSEYLAGNSSWSRGPSPLRNCFHANTLPSPSELSETTMRAEGKDVWQPTHGDGEELPPSECQESRSRPTHHHICHWNDNGPCKSGGFATKEELNWHVKAVHLLVCPVLGCTEGSFANESLVDCHIRWAHKDSGSTKSQDLCQSSNLLDSVAKKRSITLEKPNEKKAIPNCQKIVEETRLKMELSIATSKKRCREQLRNVAERKLKTASSKYFTPRV